MKIKSFVRFLMVLLACVSYSHGVFAQMLSEFCLAQNANDLHDYSDLKNYSCGDEHEPEKAWVACFNGTAIKYICEQCNFEDNGYGIFIDKEGQRICSHTNGIDVKNEGDYKRIKCNDSGMGIYYGTTGSIQCGICSDQGLSYMAPDTESVTSDYDIYEIGRCVNCSDFNSSGYGLDSSGHCSKCSLLQGGRCVESCREGYVATNGVCEKCPSDGYEWNGSCIATCPEGTISTEDRNGAKYCATCPSEGNNIAYNIGTNPRCVDSCPNGSILKTKEGRKYCDLCEDNKPYSYNGACYKSGETGGTDTCPAGTIPSVDSETGGYYCKNCETNKVAIDIYQIDENNRKTWSERKCIVATKCGELDNGLQSFKVDSDGKTCVPKCEQQENCNTDLISCSGSQGLGEITNQTFGTSSSNYIKNHYGCRACTDGEMLVPANSTQVNPKCTTANDSACGDSGKVTWKKDGDSVPTCYTCDELNMQSGCTTSGGIFTQGTPKSGYYFEGGDSGRSKEPKFCQYKETDNPKKCWINDNNSSDGNNNCVNCDTSKLIKTFDDYGPDRLYAVNTTATCPAGTYIYNSECVACTGTLSNGEYKGVSNNQCGSCGDNAFVVFTCDDTNVLHPSCNGNTIKGQQCVEKTDVIFTSLIEQSGYSAYKARGYLDSKTNSIQLCNLSVFHECTTGACIDGSGVGISGNGVSRICEKCEEGSNAIYDTTSGLSICSSCESSQGPMVVNVNASGNGDGGGFSITSDVYYWRCTNDCKYEGWGKNGSSCIKCADQGMRVGQVDSQNVCEFCPDGTGWDNESGACTACMGELASYNGKCLNWGKFENEINPSCENNSNITNITNITSCNRNPFRINNENQVVLDENNYTIQNGRVVWKGSGNDNPHRYYKERLTAGKQAWRPCSNGCCYNGRKNDVKDVTKFAMPGMACTCNGIKCTTSVLSCSDVLGKKREDSSTTYENRIKEILSGTGYQYNPTEITLFIRDSVCNSNLKITKFCRDRNNTDSCIDFSNIKWLDVAQPSSKYLYYSTGIEIPPEVSIDTNIGEGSKD